MQKWTEENILKSSTRDFLKVPLKISLQFKITKHIEKKIQPWVRVGTQNKKFN